MDRLLEIIRTALGEDAEIVVAAVEALAGENLEARAAIGDDALTTVEAALLDLFDSVRAGDVDGVSADDVEILRSIGATVEGARGEVAQRAEAAEARAAEVAEIEAGLRPAAETDTETEGETVVETEAETDPEAEPAVETEVEAVVPEPVAASTRPPLGTLRTGTPARAQARPAAPATPGYRLLGPAGEVTDRRSLAEAMAEGFTAARGSFARSVERQRLGRIEFETPEHRTLHGRADDLEKIEAVVADAMNPNLRDEAIVASGGFCAPAEVDYTIPVVSVDDRPVRDGLPAFTLDRGSVQVATPPTLADVNVADGIDPAAAVTVWTNADDVAAPGAGDVKGRQCIDCSAFTTYETAAIVRRLCWGNFGARALPENVEAWNDLVMAAQARLAETRLLDQIKAGSTQATTPGAFGASRDLIEAVRRAAAGWRSSQRVRPDATLRVIMPAWVLSLGSVDLVRGLQSDPAFVTDAEAIFRDAVADAGVNVSFTYDSPSTGVSQVFADQAAGVLNPWPTAVQWALFDEGHWLFGNGGTLDLGVVRSPALNDTNDVENFAESFEVAIKKGIKSTWITSTVCPDGTSGAGVDAVTCAS